MLDQKTIDLKFASDIHTIAVGTVAIAKSLAVIAGIMSAKNGGVFLDPSKAMEKEITPKKPQPPTTTMPDSPSVNDINPIDDP